VKIAVSARPLLGPVTGVSRYLISMMREIERTGRFDPEYFYSTHWSGILDQPLARAAGPGLLRLVRASGPLRALARAAQRRKFASGVRRGGFAFYFEPNYIPLATDLPTVITIHDLSHVRHPDTHPAGALCAISTRTCRPRSRARRASWRCPSSRGAR
jgi:alpha-1,3-rhamnosyl/mannosyltransferase